MTASTSGPCIVCRGTRWIRLPDPGPRSMASDWRIVEEPLARAACASCGLVRRPVTSDARALYESGYALYAHAPGEAREHARQQQYADWIAGTLPRSPARVLDVGCGNGSLLRALRSHWRDADLLGCDPSADAVAHGAGPGVRLWQGSADDLPDASAADLVVSVNVIEHTGDPLLFLQSLRRRLAPGGHVAIVCPDGGKPGLDLLFADHVFSFARAHLLVLFRSAGLDAVTTAAAPPSLGAFQMIVGREGAAADASAPAAAGDVHAWTAYLERWRQLDDRLLARLSGSSVCFGAGEAAGLLRAYAPRAWASVRACTVDGESSGMFGSLPTIPLDAVPSNATILVGVRPSDQPRVAERLSGRFARVVTWYDFVDGE